LARNANTQEASGILKLSWFSYRPRSTLHFRVRVRVQASGVCFGLACQGGPTGGNHQNFKCHQNGEREEVRSLHSPQPELEIEHDAFCMGGHVPQQPRVDHTMREKLLSAIFIDYGLPSSSRLVGICPTTDAISLLSTIPFKKDTREKIFPGMSKI